MEIPFARYSNLQILLDIVTGLGRYQFSIRLVVPLTMTNCEIWGKLFVFTET